MLDCFLTQHRLFYGGATRAIAFPVEALLGCEVDVVSRGGVSPYLAEYIFAEEVPL
ncbi:MAG: hypothetical protein L6435_03370 [Anaerolineae bacterium]|nr:hypothetical protein [Anaerolineae bacterium]